MSVKLISGFNAPLNWRSNKIKIAAALAGVKLETVEFDEASKDKTLYAQNCAPTGNAPSLQTEQGYLFESSAILRHMARLGKGAGLYGTTDFEASSVDAWLDFVTTELDGNALVILGMVAGFRTLDAAGLKAASDAIVAVLEGVDKWLEIRTFLVGERITIADVALFATVDLVLRTNPHANDIYNKAKNVVRHYLTVLHQAKVQEALKSVGHDGLVPAKPKEEKKAAEPKAAAAEKPKKEEKPKAADEDEDEADQFQEKKKPNPLDALPPSTFVLDAFKREYSNTDTRSVAAPYLFKNFDNAGFSMWWCNYKYNEENKMQFMTANLVRGWFQRMDHVRKYGFGVALIIGEDTKHEITGLWIFRGKGMPEIVAEVDDTELFTWTEIADPNAEKDKITDYLCWDGATFAGKPVLEGRAFK